MSEFLKLPIGTESFQEIRTEGFYRRQHNESVERTFYHGVSYHDGRNSQNPSVYLISKETIFEERTLVI